MLGKLAAQLVPVLGLLACTLPLLEILALVGGLDPNALLGAFVVAVGIAVLGSSLALFFSLWVGKTHEAILGTYAVWSVWLLWAPISSIVRLLFPKAMFLPPPLSADPFWLAFAPYRAQLVAWQDYVLFLEVALAVSAMLVAMAVFRLRRSSPAIPSNAGRRDPCSSGWSSTSAGVAACPGRRSIGTRFSGGNGIAASRRPRRGRSSHSISRSRRPSA